MPDKLRRIILASELDKHGQDVDPESTAAELAQQVLNLDLCDEGYCAHCGQRVGNWLPGNDDRHKSWCIVLVLRKHASA